MNDIVSKLRQSLAPAIGLAQLLLVVALVAMATVFVLRTFGGLQVSAVPRFDWPALAVLAGCVYVLK